MYDNKFGEKLRHLRKVKGYTQEFLAEKADIDAKHLSKIENCKYFPTYETLTKLLKALEVSIDDAGLGLEYIEPNNNTIYIKALQILNSAKSDVELSCYLSSLECMQKNINILKKS